MTRVRIFLARLRGLTRGRSADRDLQAEISAHLEESTDDFVSQGLSRADARRAAMIRLGGVTQLQEAHRDSRSFAPIENILRDIRYAVRRLARTPMFTVAMLLTLALCIGANTATFSVVNGVLLRALPFPEPDRLVAVWQTAPGVEIEDLNASIADYVAYREHSRTLSDVALWNRTSVTVAGQEAPEQVDGLVATFRLLPLLGVQPVLGRPFVESDDEDSSTEVMMLSHGYWQRRFGGDRAIVGRRLTIDGRAREVIGVLPEDFWFMDVPHDVVVPLRFNRATVRLAGYNFHAVGRMRPGVTIPQVDADVARLIPLEQTLFPPPAGMSLKQMDDARLAPNVRPLIDDLLGNVGDSLWVIMATLGIVLVIACANVGNLMLVRAEARTQELAVRAAIGAGRARLAGELLVESLVLALAAGVVGLVFAFATLQLVLRSDAVILPRSGSIATDATSAAFAFLLSIVAGLIFGAVPVLKPARVAIVDILRAGGRHATAGRDRNLTRNLLTMVQVALALILLVGSGLMIRTLQSMNRVQPGFSDPSTLQTFRVAFTASTTDPERRVRRQHDMVDTLAGIPGVTGVSLISGLPMTGWNTQDAIVASDRTYAPNTIPPLRRFVTAAPDTFKVLGTRIVAGREYTWTDVHERRPVVLISDGFARELWGTADAALGKRIRENPSDPWNEIVGVVADIRYDGVDRPAPTTVYWPLRTAQSVTYLVRSTGSGSEALAAAIRDVVARAGLPATQVRTMGEIYERSTARTTFTLTLLSISGGMALLLAIVGTYAVISYTVSQRTREMGIRLALGARHEHLQIAFVRHGMLWSTAGVGIGLLAALPLSRLMSTLLFDVSPVDPATYTVMSVALLVAAALASYVPARRVRRIEAIEALRSD